MQTRIRRSPRIPGTYAGSRLEVFFGAEAILVAIDLRVHLELYEIWPFLYHSGHPFPGDHFFRGDRNVSMYVPHVKANSLRFFTPGRVPSVRMNACLVLPYSPARLVIELTQDRTRLGLRLQRKPTLSVHPSAAVRRANSFAGSAKRDCKTRTSFWRMISPAASRGKWTHADSTQPADQVRDQHKDHDGPDDPKPPCPPSGIPVIAATPAEQQHQQNNDSRHCTNPCRV